MDFNLAYPVRTIVHLTPAVFRHIHFNNVWSTEHTELSTCVFWSGIDILS